MSATLQARPVAERAGWRAVAMPSEHGGWGLTLEPVLLGLLVAWSGAGVALGVAAFTAFLLRTPTKLVAVDLRRDRWLPRSGLALRFAVAEAVVAIASVAVTVALAGWRWALPVAVAAPLVAIEFAYDIRSRGRRLLPELCGGIGVAAVSAAIVVSGGGGVRLGAAVWLVLAARVAGAVPFVRVQIMRLRRGQGARWHSDLAQAVAVAAGVVAVVVDRRVAVGAAGVALLAALQTWWVRRPPVAPKQLGLRQMAMGLALVALTAIGVWW